MEIFLAKPQLTSIDCNSRVAESLKSYDASILFRFTCMFCLYDVQVVARWIVDGGRLQSRAALPLTLSLSPGIGNVIVLYSDGRLSEFSPPAASVLAVGDDDEDADELLNQPIRELQLASADSFQSLSHALPSTADGDDAYVICHGCSKGFLHRVAVVGKPVNRRDDKRLYSLHVIRTFGSYRGSTDWQLNQPRHLAISGGIVFVADGANRRVVALSTDLRSKLGHVKTEVAPRRLCVVDDLLYVGLENGLVSVYKWRMRTQRLLSR
jgi:hypothetical protein